MVAPNEYCPEAVLNCSNPPCPPPTCIAIYAVIPQVNPPSHGNSSKHNVPCVNVTWSVNTHANSFFSKLNVVLLLSGTFGILLVLFYASSTTRRFVCPPLVVVLLQSASHDFSDFQSGGSEISYCSIANTFLTAGQAFFSQPRHVRSTPSQCCFLVEIHDAEMPQFLAFVIVAARWRWHFISYTSSFDRNSCVPTTGLAANYVRPTVIIP